MEDGALFQRAVAPNNDGRNQRLKQAARGKRTLTLWTAFLDLLLLRFAHALLARRAVIRLRKGASIEHR